MENNFKDYAAILEHFDEFCDNFEGRAAEAFMRGDQNDGRVTSAAAGIGDSTPDVVGEIPAPGPADIPARESIVDVSQTYGE